MHSYYLIKSWAPIITITATITLKKEECPGYQEKLKNKEKHV